MNNQEVEAKHKKLKESLKEMMKGKGGTFPESYPTVAIGYLELNEPYEEGEVPAGFINKLKAVWGSGCVIASMGHHDCEFCHPANPAQSSSEKILRDEVNKVDYVFPEMIFHYIEEHNFKPKEEFISKVMRCVF